VAEAIAGLEEESQTRGGLLKAGAGALAGFGVLAAWRPGAAQARGGGTKARDIKIHLEAAFSRRATPPGSATSPRATSRRPARSTRR